MRLLIRTSRWAIWAARFAVFALPILALSVWLHRKVVISSGVFTLFLFIVTILAIAAVFSAVIAMIRIWETGDRGWQQASMGMVFGALALLPASSAIPNFVAYPTLNDITTDIEVVPGLNSGSTKKGIPDWQKTGYLAKVTEAFPNLVTRIYDVSPQVSWIEIEALASEQDWRIILKQSPLDQFSTGQLSATVHSLFGYYDDLTVRVEPDMDGVRVDMRSASRYGDHDLGKNGLRIEKFLIELDSRMELARQRLAAASAATPQE